MVWLFFVGKKQEREPMLGTTAMLDQLRGEGYTVSAGYLQYLLRERTLAPPAARIAGVFIWEPADVDRVRRALRRRGRGPERAEEISR